MPDLHLHKRQAIRLKTSRRFIIQQQKEPIATLSRAFSRSSRQLHVFTSSFDWFPGLPWFFVISQSDCHAIVMFHNVTIAWQGFWWQLRFLKWISKIHKRVTSYRGTVSKQQIPSKMWVVSRFLGLWYDPLYTYNSGFVFSKIIL